MIRSLRDAGVVELGQDKPRVHEDFQSDFSLNQALSLYVVEAVEVLDPEDVAYPLDVLTLVEATLEDPWAVLYRQTDTLKSRALASMKAEGMEYDERMAELDKIDYPKPNAEFLYGTYEVFSERHPWVGNNVLRPKSIARDMYELGMSFVEYVKEYGLQRSEGVLLRYLTDAYKGFVQTVPEAAKTDELYDVSDWLGLTVRSVDASLLDEWEQLQSPGEDFVAPVEHDDDQTVDITKDVRGFTTMARNAVWQIVRFLAFKQYDRAAEALSEVAEDSDWSADRFAEALQRYWAEYDAIQIGPDARSSAQLKIERGEEQWDLTQILLDPDDHRSWHMQFKIDLPASRNAAAPVLKLRSITD
jgi:hypothetical protein